MTGLTLSGGEELSRSFEPCLNLLKVQNISSRVGRINQDRNQASLPAIRAVVDGPGPEGIGFPRPWVRPCSADVIVVALKASLSLSRFMPDGGHHRTYGFTVASQPLDLLYLIANEHQGEKQRTYHEQHIDEN